MNPFFKKFQFTLYIHLALSTIVSTSQNRQLLTSSYKCSKLSNEQECIDNRCRRSREDCKAEYFYKRGDHNSSTNVQIFGVMMVVGFFVFAICSCRACGADCNGSWVQSQPQTALQRNVLQIVPDTALQRNVLQVVPDIALYESVSQIILSLQSREFPVIPETQICTICLEELKEGERTTILACGHWYHKSCIEEWIKTKGAKVTCPICNFKILDSLCDSV